MSDITSEYSADELAQINAMRDTFPFRLIYTARKGTEFRVDAVVTMHRPKRLAREGWIVHMIERMK